MNGDSDTHLPQLPLLWANRRFASLPKFLKIWHAQGDDLRAFLTEFVAALPQVQTPAGLALY